MVRYLKEDDVKQLLTMADAIEWTGRSLKDRALGLAIDVPRERIAMPTGVQHVLQASSSALGLNGFKYYYTRPTGRCHYVHLIDTDSGQLTAIIEAKWMSMVRTGAASAVATEALALPDASVVGQIGAGLQGIGQLEAVCAVRKIRTVRVFSRDAAKREAFCKKMAQQLGIEVLPAASGAEAVKGAHIVNIITKSALPVLRGEWLEPGQHINAAGSNALSRQEIDLETVKRCDLITVDSRETARKECGDLLPAVEGGLARWETLTDIGDVLAGLRPGRTAATQITLYESHGMGVQDLYAGKHVLDLARAGKLGTDLPIG
jgi:ornithine cyclodeaminase